MTRRDPDGQTLRRGPDEIRVDDGRRRTVVDSSRQATLQPVWRWGVITPDGRVGPWLGNACSAWIPPCADWSPKLTSLKRWLHDDSARSTPLNSAEWKTPPASDDSSPATDKQEWKSYTTHRRLWGQYLTHSVGWFRRALHTLWLPLPFTEDIPLPSTPDEQLFWSATTVNSGPVQIFSRILNTIRKNVDGQSPLLPLI